MSATTVNTFPPLHEFNSSRGWFLALIVLVHLGFFWAFTHGMTFGIIKTEPKTWVVDVPIDIVDEPLPVPPEPTDLRDAWVDPIPLPSTTCSTVWISLWRTRRRFRRAPIRRRPG